MNAFMFSGQGSHYFQMGRELFDREPTFRRWMLHIDGLARERVGTSVVSVLYADANRKSTPFERLRLTSPAIFMVEIALAKTLIERGIHPDCVLGSSLGSFAASAIAGCIDVEIALQLLISQTLAFEAYCPPGGMLAVFAGLQECRDAGLLDQVDIATENSAGNFTVAAPVATLDHLCDGLKARGMLFQRLAVEYPFHSRWIDIARPRIVAAMGEVPVQRASIPMACCAHANVLRELPEGYFWKVAREPVRFAGAVRALEALGTHSFIDLGPAGSLATGVKQLLAADAKPRTVTILSPFGGCTKNFEAALGLLAPMSAEVRRG